MAFPLYRVLLARFGLSEMSERNLLDKGTGLKINMQVFWVFYFSIGLNKIIEKFYRNLFGSINIFLNFASYKY